MSRKSNLTFPACVSHPLKAIFFLCAVSQIVDYEADTGKVIWKKRSVSIRNP